MNNIEVISFDTMLRVDLSQLISSGKPTRLWFGRGQIGLKKSNGEIVDEKEFSLANDGES